MAEITGAELELDRLISADPDNGIAAVKNSDGTVSNIVSRSQATADVTWAAPANSSGTNTRRHLFDRAIVSTAAITGTTVTGTSLVGPLATAAQPSVTSLGTLTALSVNGLSDISGASGGQVKFPASQNASANTSTLDDYIESTFDVTLTGVAGTVTGTVQVTKVGNKVTLQVPPLSGTSNATTKTLTGVQARYIPVGTKRFLGQVQDNGGAFKVALITIDASGVISFSNGLIDAGGFTGSGTFTNVAFAITYSLA